MDANELNGLSGSFVVCVYNERSKVLDIAEVGGTSMGWLTNDGVGSNVTVSLLLIVDDALESSVFVGACVDCGVVTVNGVGVCGVSTSLNCMGLFAVTSLFVSDAMFVVVVAGCGGRFGRMLRLVVSRDICSRKVMAFSVLTCIFTCA